MKENNQLNLSKFITFLCLIIYIASYIGRHNYSAALASIIASGTFTKAQAGIIGTVYFAVYGSGQIIFGYVADRVSPYKLISAGLFGSALANFLMTFTGTIPSMTVVWALNGVSQSVLWPGIFYMISNLVNEEYRNKACLVMSVSVPIGIMSAYFLAGYAIKTSWQRAFFYPSIIVFAAAIFFVFCSFYLSKRAKPQNKKASSKENKSSESGSYYKILFTSGIALMFIPILLHGMLRDGINAWVPTMITETYTVSPSFSVFVSVVLPVINLAGAYIAMFIYERFSKGNEIITAVIALIIGIFPTFVLVFLGKINLITSVVMLALTTTFITSFNHMTVTLMPLRFAKYNKAATLTGTLNSITYAGCALSNYIFGYSSEHFGWNYTVIIWLCIFVLGALVSALAIKRWGKFIKE